MQLVDLLWTIVSFVLTLLVFSYLFGDNPVFRIVSYLFVGVAAGYVAVVVIYQVVLFKLVFPLMVGTLPERLLTLAPLLLGLLLLARLSPRLGRIGTIPMAYLVGAGAAVVIGGATLGTLVSQGIATVNLFDFEMGDALGRNRAAQLLEGLIILIGTISTLAYFHFGARVRPDQLPARPVLVEIGAGIGQVFIAITLGALFAGVYIAALTALIDRLAFLRGAFQTIMTLF